MLADLNLSGVLGGVGYGHFQTPRLQASAGDVDQRTQPNPNTVDAVAADFDRVGSASAQVAGDVELGIVVGKWAGVDLVDANSGVFEQAVGM